jgi:hypothetical protein
LTWFNVALASNTLHDDHGIPKAWAAASRRQLLKPIAITWEIPKAELGKGLEKDSFKLGSSPVYVCGTGVHLTLEASRDRATGVVNFGVYTGLCSYSPPGFDEDLCDAASGLALHCNITRDVAGHSSPQRVTTPIKTFTKDGWGKSNAFTATTPADLEPYLVDGCLKLRATIKVL